MGTSSAKQELIAALRREIEAGELRAGDRLPSTKALAESYGIAFQTAHNALTDLAADGWVVRRPRAGTFVAGRTQADLPTVAVVTNDKDWLWAQVTAFLIDGLQRLPALPLPIRVPPTATDKDLDNLAGYRHLCQHPPAAMIMATYGAHGKLPVSAPTYLLSLVEQDPAAANCPDLILPDFAKSARLATEHLLDLGHRRIGCLKTANQRALPFRTSQSLFADGYDAAMADAGQDSQGLLLDLKPLSNSEAAITQFLREQRPSAMVCSLDHRAVEVIRFAKNLGLRVPGDLAVIGAYDTEWSEPWGLTSLNYHFQEMAEMAVDMVASALAMSSRAQVHRHLTTTPTLTVRTSCGSRASVAMPQVESTLET